MTLKIGFLKSVIALGGIFLFAVQGFAGVSSFYKWKDDQGKVHYTDDPLKIPSPHRSSDKVETRRGLPPPKLVPVDSPALPKKENEDSLSKRVSVEEQAAMQDALSFLKSDIQRYKKYEDYIPEVRHARLLTNDIVAALPAKEALGEKLEHFESTLLTDIKNFLKQSLQRDYQAKDLWPRRRGFIVERSRINEELPQKTTLVEKLETELAALPEPGPAPSKPLASSPDNKESGVKNPETGNEEVDKSTPEKY